MGHSAGHQICDRLGVGEVWVCCCNEFSVMYATDIIGYNSDAKFYVSSDFDHINFENNTLLVNLRSIRSVFAVLS